METDPTLDQLKIKCDGRICKQWQYLSFEKRVGFQYAYLSKFGQYSHEDILRVIDGDTRPDLLLECADELPDYSESAVQKIDDDFLYED